jgi:quinol monooxygenase YgiN
LHDRPGPARPSTETIIPVTFKRTAIMSSHVYWVLETNIREGKLDELKSLMKEMVDATRANEPGTLNYEWSISEDNRKCILYEKYADSAAAMKHMMAFGQNFAPRFMGCLDIKKLVVYGTPSEDVKKGLAAQGGIFMKPFGGFAR